MFLVLPDKDNFLVQVVLLEPHRSTIGYIAFNEYDMNDDSLMGCGNSGYIIRILSLHCSLSEVI
jgi:hypothetical protein